MTQLMQCSRFGFEFKAGPVERDGLTVSAGLSVSPPVKSVNAWENLAPLCLRFPSDEAWQPDSPLCAAGHVNIPSIVFVLKWAP